MERLVAAMQECRQTPTQTVLEHGNSVWDHFEQLLDHLINGTALPNWWRVPQWAHTHGLLDSVMPLDIVEEYIRMHDCFIHTPQEASTQHRKGWSRLRVKTTMTITNADEDTSPDFRAMATATALGRIMNRWNVEPEICFNSQGGIHLSWLGDMGHVEIGVEKDGWCDWTIMAPDRDIQTSNGLVDARAAASVLTAFMTEELTTIAA